MADLHRLLVDSDDLQEAWDLLESNFVDCDLDSGNRLLIDASEIETAIRLFEENGINYDEI